MKKDTPKAVADTLLEAPVSLPDGVVVQNLTMARYALLELVDSPFVVSGAQFTISSLIPTFYVMCAPKEELTGYTSANLDQLKAAAMAFAEELTPDVTSLLIDTIAKRMGLLQKVTPEAAGGDPSEPKKAR